jgi:hypothetical protein
VGVICPFKGSLIIAQLVVEFLERVQHSFLLSIHRDVNFYKLNFANQHLKRKPSATGIFSIFQNYQQRLNKEVLHQKKIMKRIQQLVLFPETKLEM